MEVKQFVKKVVSFSSQYGGDGSKSYTAGNLAGESYNFPAYGDFTQAFVLVSARIISGPEQSMKIDDRKINRSIDDNRLITVD